MCITSGVSTQCVSHLVCPPSVCITSGVSTQCVSHLVCPPSVYHIWCVHPVCITSGVSTKCVSHLVCPPSVCITSGVSTQCVYHIGSREIHIHDADVCVFTSLWQSLNCTCIIGCKTFTLCFLYGNCHIELRWLVPAKVHATLGSQVYDHRTCSNRVAVL